MANVRLPAPLAALAAVARNASLRRVLVAFFGFSLAEWSTWIAILVFAYERGGATETGIIALVQLAPSTVVAPLAASLGDHVRRERALLLAYLVQFGAMAIAALALLLDAHVALIYAAAVLTATSITLTRPVQAAMLPELSRTPAELTAANVVSGTVETASILAGPVVAGLALALTGPGVVFLASAVLVLAGAVLVSGVRPVLAEPRVAAPGSGSFRELVTESVAGLGMLLREPRSRTLVLLMSAAAMLWGAIDVLLVVLSFDLLGLGEAGVGYLNAAIGAGGLVGAAASLWLIGRSRLAMPLLLGLLLWAAPVMLVGAIPAAAAALALLAGAGLGRVLLDVAARTLLQRVAPDRMLSRVFGVVEGLSVGSLAIGSGVAATLVGLVGAAGAFVAAGAALLAVTILSWRAIRRLDDVGLARPRELELLRGIPMFSPLGGPALERMAANLVPIHAHAGSVVVHQGEPGAHFYIIGSGRVAIEVDGRRVREEAAGESFGEIALLRDVPRTATVLALESSQLLALERRVFLEAVTGQPASADAAERLVGERLHGEPAGAARSAALPADEEDLDAPA
jgi:MFS family permease